MSVGGVCDICGRAAKSLNTCEICGQNVCNEHYVVEEGVCQECISRRGM